MVFQDGDALGRGPGNFGILILSKAAAVLLPAGDKGPLARYRPTVLTAQVINK